MGRSNGSTNRTQVREQASKRARHQRMTAEVDLMVRFSASRDRDRQEIGR